MSKKYFAPLFWVLTVVGLLSGLQSYFFIYRLDRSAGSLFSSIFIGLIYNWYYLGLSAVLYFIIPLQMNEKTKKYIYLVHLPVFFISALLHQLLYGYMQQRFVGIAIDFSIAGALLRTTNAWIDYFVYIIFLLVFYSINYRKMLLDKAVQITETQMQLSRSVLSEMRNRLHPEFFFYSLNSIQSAVQHDRFREADKLMSSLSSFLRGTVYGSQDIEVELHEELGLIESYMATRSLCSNAEYICSITCPAELKDSLVLNRQIFSLAENVFLRDLILIVRNDGDLLAVEMAGNVSGEYVESVNLVEKYLREYYGSRSDVALSESEDGFKIELHLPLKFKNQSGV